jgi:hypothetical protein
MTTTEPKRRWYRLTPDRFFVGLLVVEAVLLLSERFQWFPFQDTAAERSGEFPSSVEQTVVALVQ